MRKLIHLAWLLFALPLFGQTNIPTWQYVDTPQSGACSGTPPIQMVYSTGAMWGCISGTWTQINGGASTGALFPATNGAVFNTSTTASRTGVGTRDGTGDYQLPITINGAGGGFSCSLAGSVWTCTLSGGGLTGAVNPGNANQPTCYPTGSSPGGTTVGPCANIYMLDPAMNASQIQTLLNGLPGTNTYIIPPGTPQALYTTNGQIPWDTRLGASYFQMPGVACDGKQSALSIAITSGSNTSTVGSLLSAADIGKTFFFFNRSGYAYGSTQSVWTAKLTNYTGAGANGATWSANAPFSANTQVYYGSDNLTAVNTANAQANAVFPLTIPTGCKLLVNGTVAWNNNQVIVGRHLNQGGFIGRPGADIIATTDTNGQSVSNPGVGLGGFAMVVGTEVDWTLGYNLYAADGTLTVVPPVYRPAYQHSSLANHPCAPGWFVNCINSVGSITAGSPSMTVPAGVKLPAVGNTVVFPYLTKVFTTAADAVNTGTRVVTLHAAAPAGSTSSQAEFFAGTAVQTTTTSIPGSPVYPYTLQLTGSIKPIPGWPSNFSTHGHAKIQDYEFDYMGVNYLTNTMVVRKGPATVNGGSGYPGTNTIVPLNPCPAKFDNPWPVTPSINAGDSTPSGANWFPGECIGNAAIAFPQGNGNVYAGTGLSGGFIKDIDFIGSAGPGTNSGNANNVADIYVAGNNAPFGSHFENLISSNVQYGIVQGPASSGQHGVAAVGPTGFGNTYHNLWLFAAFPLAFVDMQGSTITEMNLNSTEVSPYDGTLIGSATCLQVGFTLDEQTGGFVTSTQFDHFDTYGCEPENGSHAEIPMVVDIQGSHISFDTANFEGIPNQFGGDHLKLTNSSLHLPAIDYGINNDFGIVDGSNSGYITNVWDSNPQFLEWGTNGKCSAWAGGLGPEVSCGASIPQGYQGRGIEPSVTGSKAYFALGGMINPWMWNNNGMFDSNPMTTTGTADTTAMYWGASATCSLSGGSICQSVHFNGFNGFLYIGPFNQLYDGPYLLDATFKTNSSSSFVLTIRAQDSGSGTCASPSTLFSGTITTGTTFAPPTVQPLVDMTGKAGCVLEVQYSNISATDTVSIDRFNLVPVPQQIKLRVATLTPGVSCPTGTANGAFLSSDNSGLYMCGNGVVQFIPFGGSLGISALTGDVVASGTGTVSSTVVRIGGGSVLNTFTGLMQNTAGVVGNATTFNLTGSGRVGTFFAAGVENVTDSATPVFNAANGNTHYLQLTTNSTSSSFSNGLNGQSQQFIICQDATGGRTFPWPPNFAGFPAVTQTASGCTTAIGFFDSVSGNVYGDQYNSAQCVNSASSNVPCGAATRGYFAVPAGTNSTLTVLTSAVVAGSGFAIESTPGAGSLLGVTCNATPVQHGVSAWTAGTSFTVVTPGTTATNPECFSWSLINP